MQWDCQGLSDVYCLLHYAIRLSFCILMYFLLSNLFVLNAFFLGSSFCKCWKPNKHCPLEMDSDVCEFDRSHAITKVESLLCFHYSLLGCDAIFRTISLLPWPWVVTLTYFMQQTPSGKTNQFAASPEILHILWNPKVHYHIHKCPSYFTILRQLNLVHTPTSQFLKINVIIFLPCMPRSTKWTLSFRFPHQSPVYASPLTHMCYMPCPSHSSRFDHTNNTGWGV